MWLSDKCIVNGLASWCERDVGGEEWLSYLKSSSFAIMSISNGNRNLYPFLPNSTETMLLVGV